MYTPQNTTYNFIISKVNKLIIIININNVGPPTQHSHSFWPFALEEETHLNRIGTVGMKRMWLPMTMMKTIKYDRLTSRKTKSMTRPHMPWYSDKFLINCNDLFHSLVSCDRLVADIKLLPTEWLSWIQCMKSRRLSLHWILKLLRLLF